MKARTAARVVLLNPAGEVLLLHVKDMHDDSRHWWITCGGGAELGETAVQTAARELSEEAGIECDPADLLGPLASRSFVMEFKHHSTIQHETYYGMQCDEDFDFDEAIWTDIEKASIVEGRWWLLSELSSTTDVIYPPQLPTLVQMVQRRDVPDEPLVLE